MWYATELTKHGVDFCSMYQGIIHYDDESGVWVARVPALPGCVSDGPTREEAISNASHAVREWLDAADELGRQRPEPENISVFDVIEKDF